MKPKTDLFEFSPIGKIIKLPLALDALNQEEQFFFCTHLRGLKYLCIIIH